ncbi:2-methylthioadenine synthetase [Cryptosporidium sp. chipmunk genotype I]|uniref:2-methylthioadenine synthetase n=1 Tax=Cryptosporidium sp. chipmunk genotype I TaxID=1280935 RepID=UPI00351AAC55|nr:2-methylthioadenine synthetase [Cryptosporidium sp. chipmunk genotype I]
MVYQKIRVVKFCTLISAVGVGIYFGWKLLKKRNLSSMIKEIYSKNKEDRKENCFECNCSSNKDKLDEVRLEKYEKAGSSGLIVKAMTNSIAQLEEGFVPGVAKIMVKNFGCNHNRSDSESMMGLLSEYGYTLVEELDECNLIVINSCTVKGPSQDSCQNLIEMAKSKRKFVVVTGCVPQADINLKFLKDVSIIGVRNIHRIVEVVELTLQGNIVLLIPDKVEGKSGQLIDSLDISLPPLSLPKIRRNPFVEIITISVGCLGNCTYCKTKQSRGDLGSYPIETIIQRINQSLCEGVKQFWLTSEDIGAYGKDIGTSLSELLREILKILPKDIMIRIGMTNPPYILNQIDEIIEIMKHPNVFEFLHIPVQSGSNRILDLMKRDYVIEEFSLLVDSILKEIPLATIATDIICGFPGENDQDHCRSVELINKYKFPVINISKFYPRPGTPAAKMKPVSNGISKSRSSEITDIFQSFNHNEYIFEKLPNDKVVKVWFIEHSEKSNHTVGHTKNYNKVLVNMDSNLLGKCAMVKLIKPHKWHIEGIVIN